MTVSSAQTVFVQTHARLHFGVLDLRGALGRWFGGIGAAAPAPALLVSARAAETLEVSGEDAERAACFARRFLTHHGLVEAEGGVLGAHVQVHRSLPQHAGLGSGTQLALAVARALAELHGVDADATALAAAVGRARRSAVGTWTFSGGGLVLEGGHRPDGDGVSPLLARLPFPPSWHCVVAVPGGVSGMSGADETAAFADLPPPPEREVERVAHLVLMGLLPALADADLATFGRVLSELQAITGRWFAPVQGGTFARGASDELVRGMAAWGAAGVGQSSWGPAVYGIVDGEADALRLTERVRAALSSNSTGAAGSCVYSGPFPVDGARVWRAETERPGAVSVTVR
jgi:beta-ribofuranosylaminobenzene 5'-phosphate synthase